MSNQNNIMSYTSAYKMQLLKNRRRQYRYRIKKTSLRRSFHFLKCVSYNEYRLEKR